MKFPSSPDSNESTMQLSMSENVESRKYFGFTRRQIRILSIYGLYNIFRGAFVLIIGPFYPPEAEKHGLSQSTIGFVMGAHDFSTFLASLIYGKILIPKFGPQSIIIFSSFNTTISTLLFGCLGYIKDDTAFVVLSFIFRFLSGAGDAGFYPSAFTLFIYEFDGLVSTTVGLFELFFGIGAIFGPIICGPLIDWIGFSGTYFSVGGCLLLSAIIILSLTPRLEEPVTKREQLDFGNFGIFQLFKIPGIYYAIFSLFTTAASIGFITGTLEAHLEQFNLSSLQVGAIFSVNTAIYMVCSPIWGQLSDRLGSWKVVIIASGALIISIGFTVLGPQDFISNDHLLWATLFGLGLHGIGIGAAIMVFFPYASECATAKGFPDTTATYGLVSSIFTLTFSLGNAFGPALSGTLYDEVGFKDATLTVIGLSLAVFLSAGLLHFVTRKSKKVTTA